MTTNTTPTPPAQRERVMTFRVTFDQLDQLKRTAKDNGTTVSKIIRKAIEIDGK